MAGITIQMVYFGRSTGVGTELHFQFISPDKTRSDSHPQHGEDTSVCDQFLAVWSTDTFIYDDAGLMKVQVRDHDNNLFKIFQEKKPT